MPPVGSVLKREDKNRVCLAAAADFGFLKWEDELGDDRLAASCRRLMESELSSAGSWLGSFDRRSRAFSGGLINDHRLPAETDARHTHISFSVWQPVPES